MLQAYKVVYRYGTQKIEPLADTKPTLAIQSKRQPYQAPTNGKLFMDRLVPRLGLFRLDKIVQTIMCGVVPVPARAFRLSPEDTRQHGHSSDTS